MTYFSVTINKTNSMNLLCLRALSKEIQIFIFTIHFLGMLGKNLNPTKASSVGAVQRGDCDDSFFHFVKILSFIL
jgi:hypothetical protein